MKKTTTISFNMDIQPLQAAVKEAEGALGGLKSTAAAAASAVAGAMKYTASQSQAPLQSVSDQLLVLRLSLGKLKASLSRAAEPILQHVLPAVQSGVWWALRLANTLEQVSRALFGGTEQTQAMASAQKTLASSAKKASRSLAAFDELDRLNAASGGGSYAVKENQSTNFAEISPEILSLANKIRETVYPLWAWLTDAAIPAGIGVVCAAFNALGAALKPVGEGFLLLLDKLSPVAAFLGGTVVGVLNLARSLFESLAAVFTEKGTVITGILSGIGDILAYFWEGAEPVLSAVRSGFAAAFTAMAQLASSAIAQIIENCGGLVNLVAGLLTGDWVRAWEGAVQVVKSQINLVIGIINAMLTAVAAGVNGIVSLLNKIRFTVPEWVPGIGGESYGISLGKVSAPQIPYLAQGAVLPANKPFLAVVGDQHSGTNVEAPLSTIQEAVALVMEDQTSALVAGFEATLGIQREILQAVLGIEVGDDVIGAAAARYSRKMAVVGGGL